jgi:hypothetical protein
MQGLLRFARRLRQSPGKSLSREDGLLGDVTTDGAAERSHASAFVERVCTFPGIFELSFHFPIFSLQDCSQPMSSAPMGTRALMMRSELES